MPSLLLSQTIHPILSNPSSSKSLPRTHGRSDLQINDILILDPYHPRYVPKWKLSQTIHPILSNPSSSESLPRTHGHRAHRSQNHRYLNSAVTIDSRVKLNQNYHRPSPSHSQQSKFMQVTATDTGIRRTDLKIMEILILQSPPLIPGSTFLMFLIPRRLALQFRTFYLRDCKS